MSFARRPYVWAAEGFVNCPSESPPAYMDIRLDPRSKCLSIILHTPVLFPKHLSPPPPSPSATPSFPPQANLGVAYMRNKDRRFRFDFFRGEGLWVGMFGWRLMANAEVRGC